MIKVPILIIGYNRPDLLRKSIETLSGLEISNIYFYLDGPKVYNDFDLEQVLKCQKLIIEFSKTKGCKYLFNDKNLGCRIAVSSAISWAFKYENKLIILEDDLIFSYDALTFIANNLLKYENLKNILTVTAHSRIKFKTLESMQYGESLYFTKYNDSWGWGTWRDRWEQYDSDLFRKNRLNYLKLFKATNFNIIETLYLIINFYMEKLYLVDTWDFQLTYLSILNNYKNIAPTKNLIKNIGFDSRATHTKYLVKEVTEFYETYKISIESIPISYNKRIEKIISKTITRHFIKAIVNRVVNLNVRV